ncbi:hypothetical protein K438DRAFT_1764258 [Mycena galopus ATCC 62051]|nr:hypothetical protein K438DRAFT_1764258 [Mycena galopus ATCC 62051]
MGPIWVYAMIEPSRVHLSFQVEIVKAVEAASIQTCGTAARVGSEWDIVNLGIPSGDNHPPYVLHSTPASYVPVLLQATHIWEDGSRGSTVSSRRALVLLIFLIFTRVGAAPKSWGPSIVPGPDLELVRNPDHPALWFKIDRLSVGWGSG